MPESIFAAAGEQIPNLPSSPAWVHKLAGLPLEYIVEPRVLRDGDGYVKGGKIGKTAPLSAADAAEIIGVLASHSSYGDRDMGARCFFPGFAFTFGERPQRVEVMVCLECSWVAFYSPQGEQWLVPGSLGEAKLKALYARLVA
jgi:hypothetical protein